MAVDTIDELKYKGAFGAVYKLIWASGRKWYVSHEYAIWGCNWKSIGS